MVCKSTVRACVLYRICCGFHFRRAITVDYQIVTPVGCESLKVCVCYWVPAPSSSSVMFGALSLNFAVYRIALFLPAQCHGLGLSSVKCLLAGTRTSSSWRLPRDLRTLGPSADCVRGTCIWTHSAMFATVLWLTFACSTTLTAFMRCNSCWCGQVSTLSAMGRQHCASKSQKILRNHFMMSNVKHAHVATYVHKARCGVCFTGA